MSSAERLAQPAKRQFDLIHGRWCAPTEELTGSLDDPNSGKIRQPQLATSNRNVERAVSAAADLHTSGAWAHSSLADRTHLLEALADGLAHRVDEIAFEDAMSTGNPINVAVQTASSLASRVRSARDELLEIGESTSLPAGGREVRLLRRPLGTAVVIGPWNAPTFVSVAKLASALAAGCPVILKPSEWAPGGCQIVAEVLADVLASLNLPEATFQLVHGAAVVGSQLVSDPRVKAVTFTGGGAGGRAVAAAAAPNCTALQLELGGHNPAVIRPDADIDTTAAALADGMTKLNGQWCEAPGKILVPESLHNDLVDALLDHLRTLRIGHCLDEATDVGPLAYSAHRAHLQQRVDHLVQLGGKALTSAAVPSLSGWFFSPTLVSGLPPGKSEHELFGPAVTVHSVGSVEEALAAADGPETGLAGFVFGSDLDAALETASRIPAGEVRVNGCKLADLADGSEQTFWNNSGVGGHGPFDLVRFFQGRRIVGVDDPALPI